MTDSRPPPNHAHLLGRLQAAWLSLDYILRLSLIRKNGVSRNIPKSARIFAIDRHTTLMKKLATAYAADNPELLQHFKNVGTATTDGLYRKTKLYIQALWAHDPASGQPVLRRNAEPYTIKHLTFPAQDTEALIRELRQTASSIEALTKKA